MDLHDNNHVDLACCEGISILVLLTSHLSLLTAPVSAHLCRSMVSSRAEQQVPGFSCVKMFTVAKPFGYADSS